MGLHSSGVLITDREESRVCDECERESDVVVVSDPETRTEWWSCPVCGADHDSPLPAD